MTENQPGAGKSAGEPESAGGQGKARNTTLKLFVLVLFLAEMVVFMLVDGNGQVLGLPERTSLLLAGALGGLLMWFSLWLAVRERRCWWWPVVFGAVNVVFLLPALGGW